MKASDIPTRFPRAFASSAGGAFIRPIPTLSQVGIQDGAASLETGFPPLNFLDLDSGGVPPWGADFNGLLKQITQWSQWQGGGGPVPWDSAFSTAVGGYPKGAILAAATFGFFWLCSLDDNTSNPDSGGADWISVCLSSPTRIVTASGAFSILASDRSIGLNRTAGVAVSSATLPASSAGREFYIDDLAGNFNAFPVTITASAGTTIAGLATFVANVNRQSVRFRYYGSSLWSADT